MITPNILNSGTISPTFFQDPNIWNWFKDKVFPTSWHYLTDTHRFPSTLRQAPNLLLPDFLDEPVVLTRNADDRIQAFSNVCTHRAAEICTHGSSRDKIVCPYHGRQFSLEGKFLFMPEFEEAQNFPSEADHLFPFSVEVLSPLIFISPEPKYSFSNWIDPLQSLLSWLPLKDFNYTANNSSSYQVDAHWALYVENYLEGFHIPFIHPGLHKILEFGAYEEYLFPYGTLQIGIAKKDEDCFDLPVGSEHYGKRIAAFYFWLYPNLMLNFYPWGLSINRINPISPTHTRVEYFQYVWKEALIRSGAGGALDQVEKEDGAIVKSVQRGIQSRYYTGGRFSPRREKGVHHFHCMLENEIQPLNT
jgi:choline monooxygenase